MFCLVLCQRVHDNLPDVEALLGRVECDNIDSNILVSECVAFAAVGRVVSWDEERPSDGREIGNCAECLVTFGAETVFAIAARDVVRRCL